MKTLKILSVGNSFTQDPHRYLHAVAHAHGYDLKCVNLVIGGCSLERHYRNLLTGARAYSLEMNGEPTGFSVSLEEALGSNLFDIVTLQQASHFSFLSDTYHPYIEKLAEAVRTWQPKAKLVIQRTWSYENGSDRLKDMGFSTMEEMDRAVAAAYSEAAKSVGADTVIPSGEAMLRAVELGAGKVHRDTFHADLGFGRYLLALTWLAALTGVDPLTDTFSDFDVPTDDTRASLARKAAHDAVFPS